VHFIIPHKLHAVRIHIMLKVITVSASVEDSVLKQVEKAK